MSEQMKTTIISNAIPYAFMVLVFIVGRILVQKFMKNSIGIAEDIQKNAIKGDDLSLEVIRNANLLSHQYLKCQTITAMVVLLLHKVLYPFWKEYFVEGSRNSLMFVLVLIVGILLINIQATSTIKTIAERFSFPVISIKKYVISSAFGNIWLLISLLGPETSSAIDYSFGILMAVFLPSLLFGLVCQKWILCGYSGNKSTD